MRRQLESDATYAAQPLLSTSKQSEQHPVGAGHAPDRQCLRHQAYGTPDFLPVDSQPCFTSHLSPRPWATGLRATLQRNGMFIIDTPFSPIATAAVGGDHRNGCPATSVQRRQRLAENLQHPAHAPQVQFAGQEVDAPSQARCSSSLSSSRDSPMDWRQSNRGTGLDTRYRPTRPHPRPAAPAAGLRVRDQLQQGRQTLQTFQGLQVSLHVVEHQRPPHPSASSNSPRASPQNRRRRPHVVGNHVIVAVAVGLYNLQAMPRSQPATRRRPPARTGQSVQAQASGNRCSARNSCRFRSLDHPHRAFRTSGLQVRSGPPGPVRSAAAGHR